MHPILEEQRAAGFPAFADADIKGIVPLRESLLNEVVSGMRQKKDLQIKALRILPRNRIEADVILKGFPLTLTIEIAPEVKVAAGQRLPLQIGGLWGVLMSIASPILQSALAKFKPLVTLEGNRAYIDIGAELKSRGYGDFAPLLRRVGFMTEPGTLYIDFNVHAG